MFFYEKRVAYLSLYESGEKKFPAGFVSLSLQKERLSVMMQVKNIGREWDNNYPVLLFVNNQRITIGTVSLELGRGSFEKNLCYIRGKVLIDNMQVEPDEIGAISIRLSEDRIVEARWKHIPKAHPTSLGQEENVGDEKREPVTEEIQPLVQEEPELMAVSVAPDKWEQLKSQFPIVHPFGDEREFISMELKDFTVLRESYQKLVNNSFLLHGFYNYRHVILGKDYKIGANSELCFYLGVPGVFYEREKMVAVMFGFEGFESMGPVETGKFGYYLRSVEI